MGLHRLAVLSFRYPKIILVCWAACLVFFGGYAHSLPSVLQGHGLDPEGSFGTVRERLDAGFNRPAEPVVLWFEQNAPGPKEEFRAYIRSVLRNAEGLPGLDRIVSPLDQEEMLRSGKAYALLDIRFTGRNEQEVLGELRGRLPAHPGFAWKLTGKPVVQADVNEASERDMRKAELIGLPAAFLILWIAFGGAATALIPVVLGMVSTVVSMGIVYWIGMVTDLSNFVLNVIPMVGLALSIDFSLMLVSRFREELSCGRAEPALRFTMRTSGRAVLYSAGCVALGLLGILFIPLPMFASVAWAAFTVLIVSVFLSFTLLPAVLSLLRTRIEAENAARFPVNGGRFWHRLSAAVMKRPLRLALLAILIVFIFILPVGRMKMAVPDAASLPEGTESRAAAERLAVRFPSPEATLLLGVKEAGAHSGQRFDWQHAYRLYQRLQRDPQVVRVDSVFSRLGMNGEQLSLFLEKPGVRHEAALLPFYFHQNQLVMDVYLRTDPDSEATREWLRKWEAAGNQEQIPFQLGGEAKYRQEVYDAIFTNLHKVLLFVLVTNFFLLYKAFGSVFIPLKTLLMNVLSITASFGLLTWIFQEGAADGGGSIAIMIPVFIFGLVFGISMDYGVFLVARIAEVYRQTLDNDYAVAAGLASTSRIITSAAAIMIAVTLPFAGADVAGVKQLGTGIAGAIFLDATLIRMILVPALMKLLGRWNWWSP
ncbi:MULTISPECIES: MMPL family transporter [unclassified Paenibacillus]|uniref:MMPL family transporter n=1 Tax=unclassified Paenibacillus TaxID=185978 RepID=UPI001E499855|nr:MULTISPECIES: MMPL family transporter [unclassified Paenibacillus]